MLEVLVSFSLIFVLVTTTIPILMKTYQGRSTITYKREALLLLHNETEAFLYDDDYQGREQIQLASRTFTISQSQEGSLVKLCVGWEVPWDQHGEVCKFAKKD